MDELPFSPTVPGNIKLEPDDDNGVPPPIVKRLDGDDSSDDKDDVKDEIVVEDVDSDDKEISEEAPPERQGDPMQTPPEYYSTNFSNIRCAYPDEERMMYMRHHGAGYGAGSGTEQGFTNMASQLDNLIDPSM